MIAARELAHLVLEAAGDGAEPINSMFATVISIAATKATVRPDSVSGSATFGPLEVICGKATVNARVLCLYVPQNGVWVVIGR